MINIGLFGFGTVGHGLYQVLQQTGNTDARIARVCVRNINKKREGIDPALFTDNPDDIIFDPSIDLVVELISDAEAAFEIVTKALKAGKPVVSGSKAMIAPHLPELIELQHITGSPLLYDASSCGSLPVIRNLEEYYDNDLLLEVKGILNGSSNFILSRVFDHGEDYASALKRAQDLGFAEADPSFDIGGYDALFKLVIITVHALGVYVAPEEIFTYGIQTLDAADIKFAREKGVKIKLVAQVAKIADDRFTMLVMPEFVEPSRYIYSVDDEYNGVVIRGRCYDRQFMFGKGAGALPTASSVLSDIMSHRHGYRYEYKKMHFSSLPHYTTDFSLRLYLRYRNTPLPSLLNLEKIHASYTSDTFNYVIADLKLSELIAKRELLSAPDIFVANIPQLFRELDE